MFVTRRKILGSACLTLLASAARAQEGDGFVTFEARAGATALLPAPAPPTQIWGFGGQTPGPVLRTKLGQEMRVRLINRLDQPTSLHWRGMRLPNAIDGAAGLVQKPVAPVETREFLFTPPDAGTYFLQPLIQPFSGEQLGRGLYAAVIVDEPDPVAVDDDLVLLLDDWRLDASGQIVGDFANPADALRQGRYGAVTGVNGRTGAVSRVYPPGARLRLRLINASNARIMRLAFEGGAQTILALDGQFCDPFTPYKGAVPLGPGARCDVLLDDWRLDASGQIVGDFANPADALRQGRYGAVTGVNGRAGAVSRVYPPGARLRLRLINASNARIMRLAFEGGAQTILALDGQFCDPFTPYKGAVPLGPGARCDVLLDLPRQEGQGARLILRGETELPDAPMLNIATRGGVRPSAPPVGNPPPNPLLPAEIRLQGAKRFDLVFEGGWRKGMPAGFRPPAEDLRRIWKINGRSSSGLDGPPLFSVKRGTAVSLAFVNRSLFELSIFVQGHVVRLLHDLDDGWEPYWRDSVIVPEKATKHIAFVADNPGKWLLGGAIQQHFAHGMAGWFEVG